MKKMPPGVPTKKLRCYQVSWSHQLWSILILKPVQEFKKHHHQERVTQLSWHLFLRRRG